MLVLCLMLSYTYYAQNHASIIGSRIESVMLSELPIIYILAELTSEKLHKSCSFYLGAAFMTIIYVSFPSSYYANVATI